MPRNSPNEYDEGEDVSLHSHRTVGAKFEHQESLEAQSHQRRRPRVLERVVEATGYGEYLEQAQIVREIGVKNAAKQTAKNVEQRFILRRLSPWLLSISLSICFMQFIFAVFSLAGFAVHLSVEQVNYYLEKAASFTVYGKASAAVTSWVIENVSWIKESVGIFPTEYIGMAFLSLASIVGLGGFICFMLFFSFLGVDMLHSTISTLILALGLALTILPVSNLLPWLFFWVLYVVSSESSIFNMTLEHNRAGYAT